MSQSFLLPFSGSGIGVRGWLSEWFFETRPEILQLWQIEYSEHTLHFQRWSGKFARWQTSHQTVSWRGPAGGPCSSKALTSLSFCSGSYLGRYENL